MWFKPAAVPSSEAYFFLGRYRHTSSGSDDQFFINMYNSGTVTYLVTPFRSQAQFGFPVAAPGALVGNWNHLVVNYTGGAKSDASSYTIYLNGTPLTSTISFGTAGGTANDTQLGTDNAYSATYGIPAAMTGATTRGPWTRSKCLTMP